MPVDQAVKEEQMRMAEELLFSGEKLPSFAKGLYAGLYDADRVFPFPELSGEQQATLDAFIARLDAYMDEHLDPDQIDRNAEIPDHVVKGLGEIGILSCTIPRQYGGLQFSQVMYCKAVEAVARRCAATALFINAHQSIGMKALLLYGSEAQKNEWLTRLATGDALAAFALTEAGAGSDAANVQTRAVYNAEKDVWVVNGKKQWITNGGIADTLTLMARTEIDGKDRVTAFLITPDMPGFHVDEVALEKVGMRGTKTAKLSFRDMEVPNANILGEPGRGLHVALHVLDFGRTTFGATCTGSTRYCLERAIKHARSRIQFKQPLANFDLVRQKLATMAAYTYAMDAMTQLTAGLVDRGQEDYMLETAMLKVFSSEKQWQVLYDCMQIFGGRSFFTDEPFARMMRDARLNPIGEGSNEVLRAFIGLVGMRDVGMKFKAVADSLKSGGLVGKVFGLGRDTMRKYLTTPEVPVTSPELQPEARELGARVRKFGLAVQRLIVHYKEDILEAQMELNRVAESAMAIYAMTAVLSKLDAQLARGGAPETDLAAGKLYCTLALDTIDRELDGIIQNHDRQVRDVSRALTGI